MGFVHRLPFLLGFMQKHFSNNDAKQIQSSSKHKIIILEHANKLEESIEKVDLPNEFGGCDFFNVTEWVEYSTAVEKFGENCKKVEGRLSKMKQHFATTVLLKESDDVDKRVRQNTQLVKVTFKYVTGEHWKLDTGPDRTRPDTGDMTLGYHGSENHATILSHHYFST